MGPLQSDRGRDPLLTEMVWMVHLTFVSEIRLGINLWWTLHIGAKNIRSLSEDWLPFLSGARRLRVETAGI